MTIDLCRNEGNRLTKVQVKDNFGNFKNLNDTKIYKVTTNTYLADGGSGSTMVKGKIFIEPI